MAVIQPAKQGRTYWTWKIIGNFLLYYSDKNLPPDFDAGLRLTIITNCWAAFESFVRGCLDEMVLSRSDKLTLPAEYTAEDFNTKLQLRDKLSSEVKTIGWTKLVKLTSDLGYPLSAMHNESWAFVKHLYSLRNGFMHGSKIKILKSNVEHMPDEITEHYVKALKYLDGKKVISIDELIDTQNIHTFLNSSISGFVFHEFIKAMNEVANIFAITYEAHEWKKMQRE